MHQVFIDQENITAKGDFMQELKITSPAFETNQSIPEKYSCDYENTNPPLSIEGIPEGTKSLALILEDPDAPSGTFVHWVVWNIPANQTVTIDESSMLGVIGRNSWRSNSYGGPNPPFGSHTYNFKVYALDQNLSIDSGAGKIDVLNAMNGHVLAKGELSGVYP